MDGGGGDLVLLPSPPIRYMYDTCIAYCMLLLGKGVDVLADVLVPLPLPLTGYNMQFHCILLSIKEWMGVGVS